MTFFKQHKKEWFVNRVGEMVEREYTPLTPISVRKTPLTSPVMIASVKHAEGCYAYHRDNKINFTEKK